MAVTWVCSSKEGKHLIARTFYVIRIFYCRKVVNSLLQEHECVQDVFPFNAKKLCRSMVKQICHAYSEYQSEVNTDLEVEFSSTNPPFAARVADAKRKRET